MTDIAISDIHVVSDISILSGVDKLVFHIYMNLGVGNKNEPMAPKTKHGWVILGERQNANNTVTKMRFPRNLIPKTSF